MPVSPAKKQTEIARPLKAFSRREFLAQSGGGIGALALAALLRDEARAAENQSLSHLPHFVPRAKRVLWLFMHGGPSHMDLWDPKPDLIKYAGQPLPASFGEVMTRRKVAKNPLLGPYVLHSGLIIYRPSSWIGLRNIEPARKTKAHGTTGNSTR